MLIDGRYTVGLLGGTFNPAHEGHVHISEQARKRYGLDAIWWLVTPGNPLKRSNSLPSLVKRAAQARQLTAHHPQINVTDIEAQLGTRYSIDTIHKLQTRFPQIRFVWLMGADNLAIFHRWHRWHEIMHTLPIIVFDRDMEGNQCNSHKALASPAARHYTPYRTDEPHFDGQPSWTYAFTPRHPASSTALRGK